MEWIFVVVIFVPLLLLAFVIMRVDLLLHFLRKDDDAPDSPPPADPPPSEPPEAR